jgi:hypothetical protein
VDYSIFLLEQRKELIQFNKDSEKRMMESLNTTLTSNTEMLDARLDSTSKLLDARLDSNTELLDTTSKLLESKFETTLESSHNYLLAKIAGVIFTVVAVVQGAVQILGVGVSIHRGAKSSKTDKSSDINVM